MILILNIVNKKSSNLIFAKFMMHYASLIKSWNMRKIQSKMLFNNDKAFLEKFNNDKDLTPKYGLPKEVGFCKKKHNF